MSYLLGYQKWRKLHESAKYGKIYEQAFNKDTGVDFIIVGGTSPTPINDAKLHTETGLPNGTGVALYEIAVKDALLNNFSAATKVKDLKIGSNNEQDQFQIVNGETIIMQVSGKGTGKEPLTFTYTPQSQYKIRFSGNGVLALYRAVVELTSLRERVKALNLDRHSGNIRLYMNYAEAPIKSVKTNKFSIGTTNILAASSNLYSINAYLTSNLFHAAIHYLAADSHKEYFKGEFPNTFAPILTNSLIDKKPIYDGVTLFDSQLSFLTEDGAFKSVGNPYTELDSFKNRKPEDFLSKYTDVDNSNLPPKDPTTGKRSGSIYFRLDLTEAIKKYMKVNIDNMAKDGGTIDAYYKLKLEGLGDDLIGTISKKVKNAYIKISEELSNKKGRLTGFQATAQHNIDGAPAQEAAPRDPNPIVTPKVSGEYEEGKGVKTTTAPPTTPSGPVTPKAPGR